MAFLGLCLTFCCLGKNENFMQVKQFHPDVRRDGEDSDLMIRRVIQAYEVIIFLAFHSNFVYEMI